MVVLVRTLVLLLVVGGLSICAHAAPRWITNVTLTSASYYWDGSRDVWEVTWQESVDTGCSFGNSQKRATWSNDGSSSMRFDIGGARMSPAMAALIAGVTVDIMVDPASCTSAYGVALHGVKLHR